MYQLTLTFSNYSYSFQPRISYLELSGEDNQGIINTLSVFIHSHYCGDRLDGRLQNMAVGSIWILGWEI